MRANGLKGGGVVDCRGCKTFDVGSLKTGLGEMGCVKCRPSWS
jgi:hypothetical protein